MQPSSFPCPNVRERKRWFELWRLKPLQRRKLWIANKKETVCKAQQLMLMIFIMEASYVHHSKNIDIYTQMEFQVMIWFIMILLYFQFKIPISFWHKKCFRSFIRLIKYFTILTYWNSPLYCILLYVHVINFKIKCRYQ